MTAIEKYAEWIKAADSKVRHKKMKDDFISLDPLDRAVVAAGIITDGIMQGNTFTSVGLTIGRRLFPQLNNEEKSNEKELAWVGFKLIQVLDDNGIVKIERASKAMKSDVNARRASMYQAFTSRKVSRGDYSQYMLKERSSLKAVKFLDDLIAESLMRDSLELNRQVFNYKPLEWRGLYHEDFGCLVTNLNAESKPLWSRNVQRTLDAVNKLQGTPFFVNEEVLNRLKESRRDIVKMLKSDSNDNHDSYRSKLYTLDRTLSEATQNLNKEVYSPVFLDSRGRTYYGAGYLSRSGDDFQKGLLMVEPEAIGDKGWDNLLVAAIDFRDKGVEAKMSYADKLALAESQIEELVGVANGDSFLDAGEMTQYLSVCIDIRNALSLGIDFDQYKSGTLLSRDASQSGPMIMGIITQDENTMKYTNVLEDTVRYDLYERLGAEMMKKLNEFETKHEIKDYIKQDRDDSFGDGNYMKRNRGRFEMQAKADFLKLFTEQPSTIRKFSKYPLMLFGYSAEEECIGADLWDKWQAKYSWLTPVGCKMLSDIYYRSCKDSIPGVFQFMKGLKKLAGIVHKKDEDLTFVSPYSGFPMMQNYRKWESDSMIIRYKGKKTELVLRYRGEKRDYHKTKSSTPANCIHSLDSDLLKMVVNKFDGTIATNHDAFFATPSKIHVLDEVLRECTKSLGTEYNALDSLTAPYGVTPADLGIDINELNPKFQPENNEFCYS